MPDAHATPVAAAISSLSVGSLGGSRYELTVVAPNARRVEISGDFTNWKPVALRRAADGRWTATLDLAVGTHRMNARVDGGGWIVPPGLTTMSDDFAGEVGLLVIEPHVGDTSR
jgi:1,4-alpha-glucan branching enzyme